jgi:hypothetical protein
MQKSFPGFPQALIFASKPYPGPISNKNFLKNRENSKSRFSAASRYLCICFPDLKKSSFLFQDGCPAWIRTGGEVGQNE